MMGTPRANFSDECQSPPNALQQKKTSYSITSLAVAEALAGVAAHPLRRGRLLLPAPWACEAMYLSWL